MVRTTNADTSINLSANGSRNAPNSVRESNHLATAPSSPSVTAAAANTYSAAAYRWRVRNVRKIGIEPSRHSVRKFGRFSRCPYDPAGCVSRCVRMLLGEGAATLVGFNASSDCGVRSLAQPPCYRRTDAGPHRNQAVAVLLA